jgi:hypothetical protein
MFRFALLGKCSFAIVLSAATVIVVVCVQGVLLFPNHVTKAWSPWRTVMRQFCLGYDGRVALVLVTVHPQPYAATPQNALAVGDLSIQPPSFRRLMLDDSPWDAICAPRGAYGFFSTERGDLFWLSLAGPRESPRLLGRHEGAKTRVLQCADDGSVLIAASDQVTAWDRTAARLLWRRTDISMTSCAFMPGSRTLLCGLENGELVELETATGVNLRMIGQGTPNHESIVNLAVSHSGGCMATVDSRGSCVVTELATGGQIWLHGRKAGGGVQFSVDGRTLIVPNYDDSMNAAMVSFESGDVIRSLRGLSGVIQNVTVTADGTAYLWSSQGTVTAWNLSAGAVTGQFRPLQDGPPASCSPPHWLAAGGVLGESW